MGPRLMWDAAHKTLYPQMPDNQVVMQNKNAKGQRWGRDVTMDSLAFQWTLLPQDTLH